VRKVASRKTADAGVQLHAVVALANQRQLGGSTAGSQSGGRVGPLGLDVAEQRVNQEMMGRDAGPPKALVMTPQAVNSNVDSQVVRGPLWLRSSSTGRDGSSMCQSHRP
jgi:hypothetical protein